MRNAAKIIVAFSSAAVLTACGSKSDQQDDRANAIPVSNSVVEVDTLPPDESSATSSDDLSNGATEPTAAENGY